MNIGVLCIYLHLDFHQQTYNIPINHTHDDRNPNIFHEIPITSHQISIRGLALALVAGELLDALVLGALFGFDLLLVGLPGSGGFDLYGWISWFNPWKINGLIYVRKYRFEQILGWPSMGIC